MWRGSLGPDGEVVSKEAEAGVFSKGCDDVVDEVPSYILWFGPAFFQKQSTLLSDYCYAVHFGFAFAGLVSCDHGDIVILCCHSNERPSAVRVVALGMASGC